MQSAKVNGRYFFTRTGGYGFEKGTKVGKRKLVVAMTFPFDRISRLKEKGVYINVASTLVVLWSTRNR